MGPQLWSCLRDRARRFPQLHTRNGQGSENVPAQVSIYLLMQIYTLNLYLRNKNVVLKYLTFFFADSSGGCQLFHSCLRSSSTTKRDDSTFAEIQADGSNKKLTIKYCGYLKIYHARARKRDPTDAYPRRKVKKKLLCYKIIYLLLPPPSPPPPPPPPPLHPSVGNKKFSKS